MMVLPGIAQTMAQLPQDISDIMTQLSALTEPENNL